MKELDKPDNFLFELRRLGVDAMVNDYLLEGVPEFFANNWEGYCHFKGEIARELNVHPKAVMLVGSSRWGFSTSPDKFPQQFDKGERPSDLDIVIAEPALFDQAWSELCEYEMDEVPNGAALGNVRRRREMVYERRLDPETFPKDMPLLKKWADTFSSLSQKSWDGGETRKVGAWIFRDWRAVQRYYRGSFKKILEKYPK